MSVWRPPIPSNPLLIHEIGRVAEVPPSAAMLESNDFESMDSEDLVPTINNVRKYGDFDEIYFVSYIQ